MNEVKGNTKAVRQGSFASAYDYRSKPAGEDKTSTSLAKERKDAEKVTKEDTDVSITLSKEGEEKVKTLYEEQQKEAEQKKKEKEEEEKKNWEEWLKQAREEQRAIRDSFNNPKKSVSYDATKDMAALAGACKIGQVKALKSRVRITANLIARSGADKVQIKLAVTKIKKVLKKAELKIKRLQEEEIIQKRQKKAEEQKQEKLVKKIKRELEKRKKKRKAEEYNDVMESAKGRGVNSADISELSGLEAAVAPPVKVEEAVPVQTEAGGTAAVPDSSSAELGAAIDLSI